MSAEHNAAVEVAVRQVAVDPAKESGLPSHFAAQCTAPAFFSA